MLRAGCIRLASMRLGDGDGAKTTIWTGGSRTILNFVHAAKRRRRLLLIGAAVTAAVAGVVAFGVLRYLSAQAATRVVESYGGLSQCLLGDPLKEGEKASVRYRAIQLGALTNADATRASGQPGWPERCAIYAHQLNESLSQTDLGEAGGKPLVDSAKALAEALEQKDSYFADLSAPLDKAFEDARAAGIALAPPADVPAPPTPTIAFDVDSVGPAARMSKEQLELGGLVVERHTSGTIRLLAGAEARKAEPSLCTFRRKSATCVPLAKPIADAASAGLSLASSADEEAPTLVFAGGGASGILRSDTGAPFEAMKSLGGHVALDGFTTALVLDGDRLALLRSDGDDVAKSAASPGLRLKVHRPELDAQLLWGHVLFVTHDDGALALAAAPVDAKRGLGEVSEVGPLAKLPVKAIEAATAARIDGCHSGETIVARVAAGEASYLSFRIGDRWSKPLKAAPVGGTLSCHHKEAAITHVASQGGTAVTSAITQQTCTPTACQSQSVVVADVLSGEAGLAPTGEISAVGLGSRVLFVWQAGQRGGLRMRLAAPNELAKAPDTVLFDGHVDGGAVVAQSTVLTHRVLAAEEFALVLVNTPRGVFVLRVAEDGKVTPENLTN